MDFLESKSSPIAGKGGMESGSSSGMGAKVDRQKGQRKPGSTSAAAEVPKIEPFVPRQGYDPRELKSWAKRTGFVSTFSGETDTASLSGRDLGGRNLNVANGNSNVGFDLDRGFDKTESVSPKIELDPILGRTRNRGVEIEPDMRPADRMTNNERGGGLRNETLRGENERRKVELEKNLRVADGESKDALNGIASHNSNAGANGNEHVVQPATSAIDPKKEDGNVDYEIGIPDGEDPASGGWLQSPRIKCGLGDNPGYGQYKYLFPELVTFCFFSF